MNDDLVAARTLAQEALARAEAATPRPWRSIDRGHGHIIGGPETDSIAWVSTSTCVPGHSIDRAESAANADFIAAARQDVPDLAALVLRLIDALERVEALAVRHFDGLHGALPGCYTAIRAAIQGEK